MRKFLLIALGFCVLAGCDAGANPSTNQAPATMGRWKFTYLGSLRDESGNSRAAYEVEDTKTGKVTLIVRGYGLASDDVVRSGKSSGPKD